MSKEVPTADSGDNRIHNKASGMFLGPVVQAGSIHGDVTVLDAPSPVIEFAVDFEIYLQEVDDFESFLRLIPDGMGIIIHVMTTDQTERFIKDHRLESRLKTSTVDMTTLELQETLSFLLKVAWQRGYLLYQFRKYDRIPLPNGSVDPRIIMDKMVGDISVSHSNLGANIDVFLQKVVSVFTERDPVSRALRMIDNGISDVIEPFLDDWAQVVRNEYGWGLHAAEIESELKERE